MWLCAYEHGFWHCTTCRGVGWCALDVAPVRFVVLADRPLPWVCVKSSQTGPPPLCACTRLYALVCPWLPGSLCVYVCVCPGGGSLCVPVHTGCVVRMVRWLLNMSLNPVTILSNISTVASFRGHHHNMLLQCSWEKADAHKQMYDAGHDSIRQSIAQAATRPATASHLNCCTAGLHMRKKTRKEQPACSETQLPR